MSAPEVFQLVQTLEFELELGETKQPVPVRVEVFQSRMQKQRYRAHLWRRNEDDMLVEWSQVLSREYDEFMAASDEVAEDRIIDDLLQSLAGASNVV